jgi:hypothetical protein
VDSGCGPGVLVMAVVMVGYRQTEHSLCETRLRAAIAAKWTFSTPILFHTDRHCRVENPRRLQGTVVAWFRVIAPKDTVVACTWVVGKPALVKKGPYWLAHSIPAPASRSGY